MDSLSKGCHLNHQFLPASEKISENLHIVGNEPSLAFYRIQEHVRKIVPVIVERQTDVAGLQQDLQGHAYDIEYALRWDLCDLLMIFILISFVPFQCHQVLQRHSGLIQQHP